MLTPYQKVIEKLKNIEDDVGQMNVDRKRTEEGRINSKQMLVPEIAVVRKEEGATVAASHLPSPWRNSAGWFRKGRTGSDSPRRFILQERPIKYHKCPTFDTKRNAGVFRLQLIDSPKQMKQIQRCR